MGMTIIGELAASSWKTSAAVIAGFIEDLGDGTFLFGEAGSVGSSSWALVEKKVLVADSDSITFSGLNGDADDVYKLTWHGNKCSTPGEGGGGVRRYAIKPNGILDDDGIAQMSIGWRKTAGSGEGSFAPGTDFAMVFAVEGSTSVTGRFSGVCYFHAKTGKARTYHTQQFEGPTGGANAIVELRGHWTDDSTNITSLEFADVFGTAGEAFTTGSIWSLYKIIRA